MVTSTLDISKLHVQSSQKEHFMRDPGIEPGSVPWQGTILPLNQPHFRFHGSGGLYWLCTVLLSSENCLQCPFYVSLPVTRKATNFELMLCQTTHAMLDGEISAVYASY